MITRRSLGAAAAALTVGLVSPPALARAGFRWPEGRGGAISLTYDDGLDSQLDNVAPQLEASGFKATFFLTRDNMEDRLNDWVALARKGHEIADHTVSHPCDLRRYTPASFTRREIDPMEQYLDANFGADRVRTFAYPCDATNLGPGRPVVQRERYWRMLQAHGILAARTTEGDPNLPYWVRRRPYLLQACTPTYDSDDPQDAFDYIAQTVRAGAWAIFVFHDVTPSRKGEGQTSFATHRAILQRIAATPLWCAPMGQVLRHVLGGVLQSRPAATLAANP